MCASIVYGYTDTTWKMVLDAFRNNNGSNEHIVIETVRLPRSLIAAAVGSSLAIAGVLMQTLTKNPLASPGTFGVNAGAGFAVVLAVTFFSVGNLQAFTWISFLGAAIAAVGVYAIGSVGREGLTPMKLTLAGAAMTAMFASFTQGFLVINEAAFEQVLFWLAGSVEGRKMTVLTAVLPIFSDWLARVDHHCIEAECFVDGRRCSKRIRFKHRLLKDMCCHSNHLFSRWFSSHCRSSWVYWYCYSTCS